MGKCIARGSKKGLVDHCFTDPNTFSLVIKKVVRLLRKEIRTMCSVKTASVLRSSNYEALMNFKWDNVVEELKIYAPTFELILQSCTGKNSRKSAIIGTCASILLKSRCSKMSLVQKMIMLILHAGHCGKQVHKNVCLFFKCETSHCFSGVFQAPTPQSNFVFNVLDSSTCLNGTKT